KNILRLTVVCLMAISLFAMSAAAQDAKADAIKALNAFYQFDRAHSKDSFSRAAIVSRQKWLTPELYQLLLKEVAKEAREAKKHPNEAPYFEGLPFTAIEEIPKPKLKMGEAIIDGDVAKIEMKFVYGKGGKDNESIWTVEMQNTKGEWLISNI